MKILDFEAELERINEIMPVMKRVWRELEVDPRLLRDDSIEEIFSGVKNVSHAIYAWVLLRKKQIKLVRR